MLLADVVNDCLEWLSARLLTELERPGDGGRHEARIGDRTEVDEVHAVGEVVEQLSRDPWCRRVFPVPPGPVSVMSRTSRRRSTSAATARSRPTNDVRSRWKVGPSGIKRSDGRELVRQAIDHELVEMLGSLEIL